MMMFRVSALNEMQKWLELNRSYLDISEPLQIQTSLHAVERLFVLFCEELGYSWATFDNKNQKGKTASSENNIVTNQGMLDLYTKSINSVLTKREFLQDKY